MVKLASSQLMVFSVHLVMSLFITVCKNKKEDVKILTIIFPYTALFQLFFLENILNHWTPAQPLWFRYGWHTMVSLLCCDLLEDKDRLGTILSHVKWLIIVPVSMQCHFQWCMVQCSLLPNTLSWGQEIYMYKFHITIIFPSWPADATDPIHWEWFNLWHQ